MTYVDLPGVRTWYEETGSGAPLVMVHGGVVDGRFFSANIPPLAERFRVLAVDLRGHGHTAGVDGPLSYDALAGDTIAFLETVAGSPADLLGHSIGAGVALMVAMRRPDLVRRLVLVSGAFHRDGFVPGMGEPDVDQVVASFGAAYGEVSPDGEAHYPDLVRKVLDMDRRGPALPVDALGVVPHRTLVMSGDDDIVTLEHTVAPYRTIAGSELAIVPGTSHFLLQEKPDVCNAILVDFLTNEPVATVAPMRRA